MMSFTNLPLEIILEISTFLDKAALNALIQTHKRAATALTPQLYRLGFSWTKGTRVVFLEDLDNEPSFFATPGRLLHFIALGGNLTLTRAFLEAGAPIDAMDERGNTLLRAACSGLNDDVVPLYLLDNGADILLADNRDRSVLSRLVGTLGSGSTALYLYDGLLRVSTARAEIPFAVVRMDQPYYRMLFVAAIQSR
jgi:hypothetical protein